MQKRDLVARGDDILQSRLKWLLFVRLMIAVLAIVSIIAFEARFAIIPSIYLYSYYTLIVTCALNLLYLFLLKIRVDLISLARWQIAIDILIVSVLVYFTGIDKMFPYLYFATVLAAALIVSARAAFFAASLAVLSLAVVSLLYFFSAYQKSFVLPFVPEEVTKSHLLKLNFLLPYIFFFSLSLYVVSLLAAKLADEVNRAKIFSDEILLNMAGGVVVINTNEKVAFMNDQAARMLFPDADVDVVGQDYRNILPANLLALIPPDILFRDRIHSEAQLDAITVELKTSILLENRFGRTGGEHPDVKGVILIINDVSLVKQMEDAKKDAEKFRALAEMSAGLAHEIRNPLASIRGAAQEIRSSIFADEDSQKLLSIVIRESDRLDKIIKDFLTFSSEKPIDFIPVNLSALLHEVIALLKARESTKKVSIESDISPAVECRCSPDKIKQVLLNVGLNALDAVGAGGKVLFRCRVIPGDFPRMSPLAAIEVIDNGNGISDDLREKVFSPFFTTKPKGVGLGLAIARNIVLSHGGDISLAGNKNGGATCRIVIPMKS